MQIPETHTSRENAQAMVNRAWPRRYPQPVELPVVECRECEGTGGGEVIVGGWEVPRFRRIECPECHGEGALTPLCEICSEPATTELGDGMKLCEEHATDTRMLDGIDFVVAFALRVLP